MRSLAHARVGRNGSAFAFEPKHPGWRRGFPVRIEEQDGTMKPGGLFLDRGAKYDRVGVCASINLPQNFSDFKRSYRCTTPFSTGYSRIEWRRVEVCADCPWPIERVIRR